MFFQENLKKIVAPKKFRKKSVKNRAFFQVFAEKVPKKWGFSLEKYQNWAFFRAGRRASLTQKPPKYVIFARVRAHARAGPLH